ncbi:hypothetical protein [Flavisolibacter ginsenosidimutans]|uniref:Uncharacterized protein n=1 Tax=Flavisolibacter ginsenosidimutans TaxID=661481 RepID=A0A5B8UFE9_9BACT|nr:hypothetical protein [Flavisolibacter ginsenosidimutans]QEC55228.1 hypothetical protein FSB75_04680 [Flavisolibacter ginsenosidimutans]
MTNSTPWQVTINANNAGKAALMENNLGTVKKAAVPVKKTVNNAAKIVIMPKRYSFDDNGGSYRGL